MNQPRQGIFVAAWINWARSFLGFMRPVQNAEIVCCVTPTADASAAWERPSTSSHSRSAFLLGRAAIPLEYTRKRRIARPMPKPDTGEDVGGAPSLPEVGISAKSLLPAQQERVREGLRELAQRHKPQRELARVLKVAQQTVSRVLAGGEVGVKLASRVADARGQTYEELLGGAARGRVNEELPGWDDAARAVREACRVPSYAVGVVARWPVTVDVERVEPRFVSDLASLWLDWATLEVRTAAETAEARRAMVATEPNAKVKSPRKQNNKT